MTSRFHRLGEDREPVGEAGYEVPIGPHRVKGVAE